MEPIEEECDAKGIQYNIIKCVHTGKTQFVGELCSRKLSSKRRIISHLYTNHGQTSPKKTYKRYIDDPGVLVPKRTRYRHAQRSEEILADSNGGEINSDVNPDICPVYPNHEADSNGGEINSDVNPDIYVLFVQIMKILGDIKPPDYLDRLPSNLEKEYQHLKANELHAWLLYYAVPCLTGILNAKYVDHFALLSEGIYILLGDSITEEELSRAENLLSMFYRDLSDLYGKGSCGLNVHNIGRHLVMYVRLWGPIFGWSCFGFEDANADILKSVHGTGDVTAQIMRYKYAQANVRSLMNCADFSDQAHYSFLCSVTSEENHLKMCWKNLTPCDNCYMAGSLKPFIVTNEEFFCAKFGVDSLNEVKFVQRVQVNAHKFYCRLYTRMKRRICYVVLVEDGSLLSIDRFAFVPKKNKVFAIGYTLIQKQSLGGNTKGNNHISIVEESPDLLVVSVDKLLEKVIFMSPKHCPKYVVRLPNLHGRSVLK